jgi:hypothetical protein
MLMKLPKKQPLAPIRVGRGIRHPFQVAFSNQYRQAIQMLGHNLRVKEALGAKAPPRLKGQPKPLVPARPAGSPVRLPLPFLRPPVTS